MVALFNAIAKAKRETVAAEEAVTSKKAAVVSAHHDDNGSVLSRETSSSSMRGNSKAAGAAGKREKEASAAAAEEEGSKNKQWAALRDDYMVGQKLTVKVSRGGVVAVVMRWLFSYLLAYFCWNFRFSYSYSIGTRRRSQTVNNS